MIWFVNKWPWIHVTLNCTCTLIPPWIHLLTSQYHLTLMGLVAVLTKTSWVRKVLNTKNYNHISNLLTGLSSFECTSKQVSDGAFAKNDSPLLYSNSSNLAKIKLCCILYLLLPHTIQKRLLPVKYDEIQYL